MKIAITFDNSTSLFQNGVQQNAIYLARLFKNAGHSVSLIVNDFYKGKDVEYIKTMTSGISKTPLNKIIENIPNVIITLGTSITPEDISALKKINPSLKIIAYKCGNELLVEMEAMLWSNEISGASKISMIKPDAIWCIPQMEHTNLSYYSLKYKQENITVVPFIWDHVLSDIYMKEFNIGPWPNREITRIATMEPNLSVMKNAFIPMAIVSKYLQQYDNIKAYHTFSTDKIAKKQSFLKKVVDFELNKISFTANPRFPSLHIMDKHADLCLSWQWENNLNYLYLDLAFYGYPVLHNANLCQDVGYYYDAFNITEAADKIDYIIKHHNNDESYIDRNKNVISRYLPISKILQDQYNILLNDVVNNTFNKYTYDSKQNIINL